MPAERTPRVRLTPVPDDGVFVVRGDELDPDVLAEDASRFRERFDEWGRYGISAFYAGTEDEVDALCQSRLVQFETVVVFERTAVEAAGVDIIATFRTPHTAHHAMPRRPRDARRTSDELPTQGLDQPVPCRR